MQKDSITMKVIVAILIASLAILAGYFGAQYLTERTLSEVQR